MKLRADKASLLGYPNYAAYSLEDQTAKTPQAVNDMPGRNPSLRQTRSILASCAASRSRASRQ